MKHRSLLLLVLVLFDVFCVSAQNTDQLLEAARKERRQILEMSENFRQEVKRQWMEYLSKPWVPVEADEVLRRPLEEHPEVPMMVLESYDYDVGETYEIPSHVLDLDRSMYQDDYFSTFPVFEETTDEESQINVSLNGFELAVRFPEEGRVALEGTARADILSALEHMLECSYTNTLRDLSKVREILSLSDWSFVSLVEELSDAVYGTDSKMEPVLLQAYLLNQFDFHLCLGCTGGGRLYKMMRADASMYDFVPYIYEDTCFYVIDDEYVDDGEPMSMIDLPSDSKRPLRMRINPDEKFYVRASKEMKFSPSRYPNLFMSVTTDVSRMEFYSDYPMFYTEGEPLTTYFHYAMLPASEEVIRDVYPVLRRAVAGRSELEAVNILLNVVQTSFPYRSDKDAWGYERYFFADELWYYGGGDCEDKSILFSRLVRDILGLPVALVYWPGHLSCAVCFPDDVKGAYFTVGNDRYVSCDPTYENRFAGAVMSNYKTMDAELILLQ